MESQVRKALLSITQNLVSTDQDDQMHANRIARLTVIFALVAWTSILVAGCASDDDLGDHGNGNPRVAESSIADPGKDNAVDNRVDPKMLADIVYTNGKIYTVDKNQPWAEAVAITGSTFIKVGSVDDVKPLIGDKTEVVDLGGKMVMPGILDLHSHPFITPWYGSMNLKLQNPGDPQKILEEVKAFAAENPDKKWILGGQWNLGIYPDNAPSKELLDQVVPERPVVLLDQTGHSSWLNSKALELAGISKSTETSNLIVIVKDEKTGEPTGTIREQALQLVERVIPQASPEEYAKPIEEIFDMFLSYGVTTQQTAEGHRAPLEALQLLEGEGRLKQRVFVSWDWKTTLNLAYTIDDIENQIQQRAKYESQMVRPNYVKIFSDGSPGDRTSLLLTHYVGEPEFLGEANMSAEEFANAFIKFDKMGVGVHVHSIGEGSIRRVVDALEKMREHNGVTGVRHKIAHCWMITPQDIDRVAKMKDVNIDFSPHIPYPHAGVSALYPPRIGEERYRKMFPVKSAIDAGIHVGQGADWLTANPTPNPFPAIEGFVTRKNPDDPSMGTLNPSEAISLAQAIQVCTLEGAWVLGVEEELGSIEEGKLADMIVLDQNLFDLEKAKRLDRIGDTHVLQSILGGKIVYDAMRVKPIPRREP